ncbi:MAG TPA: hypothetical protein VNJ01_13390 [Bacteriovoracaceae bacterium]|nr:hypothetical protein [Bacteriovoracaceae bacterium]
MKALLFFTLALFSFGAAAVTTWNCKEIYDVRLEVLKPRISVVVQELRDITKIIPGPRQYDAVYEVRVTIISTFRGQTTILKQFVSTSAKEDVNYKMASMKERVAFWMYLDELDQSGIKFQDGSRVRNVSLNCTSNN